MSGFIIRVQAAINELECIDSSDETRADYEALVDAIFTAVMDEKRRLSDLPEAQIDYPF